MSQQIHESKRSRSITTSGNYCLTWSQLVCLATTQTRNYHFTKNTASSQIWDASSPAFGSILSPWKPAFVIICNTIYSDELLARLTSYD
jgi:hypothetical protein